MDNPTSSSPSSSTSNTDSEVALGEDTFYRIRGHGPLLLTSPHTVRSLRDNKEIHLREKYIYDILEALYEHLGPEVCTLMTWRVEYFQDHHITPEDPNFLTALDHSPWFRRLRDLVNGSPETRPYVHFDIHGMRDDSTPNDIEFGMSALRLRRPLSYVVLRHLTETYFREMDIPLGFDSQFQGWKPDQFTVTEQGVLLGNYSIQIELGSSIRRRLAEDKVIQGRFADALLHTTTRFRLGPPTPPPVRRRVGILSIPIYAKLRRRIKRGTSYISEDYHHFVRNRLDADPVSLPFDLDNEELAERLRGVHAVVIPGGSYGSITDTEGDNTKLLRKFIDSFFHIVETMKELNDQGIFMPIYGICLGFQLLCLASQTDREGIIRDVRRKEGGLIMRRLSSLQLCKCELKERFEQVLRVPLDLRDGLETSRRATLEAEATASSESENQEITYNQQLHYFLFTNHRIIPYTEATLDQFKDLEVMTVYRNRAGLRVMSSVRHSKYPFIGFQFHPEKPLQMNAPYMQDFYQELQNLVQLPVVYGVRTEKGDGEERGEKREGEKREGKKREGKKREGEKREGADPVACGKFPSVARLMAAKSQVQSRLADLQHAGTYTNRHKTTYFIY